MLCNINLCRYFNDSYGVSIGMFLACNIHCVSNGVGVRGKFSKCVFEMGPTCCF